MPNDRLMIAGGNLHQVEGDGADASLTTLAKPDDLQQDMWKNVYPLRMEARSETKALGEVLVASPKKAVREDGDDFLIWQQFFGQTSGATNNTGDADGDGDVDGNDFLIWQAAQLSSPPQTQ